MFVDVIALLIAVADTFDTNALHALADMRAPDEAVARMALLAERANQGLLTVDERHEYHSAVSFGNFFGRLQKKYCAQRTVTKHVNAK